MTTVAAEADLESGRIFLVSDWSQKDRVKGLPGSKWHTDHKRWSVPLSWQACIALRGEFTSDLQIGPVLSGWARSERVRVDQCNEMRHWLEMPPSTSFDFTPWGGTTKFDLFGYQQAGAVFLATAEQALLADEMGTGKTASTLSAIRLLQDQDRNPFPVLIVCPNTVKRNWENEISLWLPGASAYVLAGSITQRRKTLARAAQDEHAVVITNIENMRSMSRLAPYGSVRLDKCIECDKAEGSRDLSVTRCETHPKEFNEFGFRTCVLDEAHRVKDPKAKQTRAIWATFHGESVRYRYALTGTPIANHPGDLWGLMHAVCPAEYQTRSKFIERYAQISWNAYGMEIHGLRADRRDEFFKFLDPRMRRVTKDRVLTQLPAKVFTTRTVELSPKQRKLYDQFMDHSFAELDSGDVLTIASNLTLATRLLQLSSATCDIEYGDGGPEDWENWQVTLTDPSSKIDELMSIIEEMEGKPLAVAAEHRRLLELAAVRLEAAHIPYAMVTGAVDEHQRAKNIEDFQAGRIQVIMFTMKAGGVGINLTRADTLVRLQRSWSFVDNKQSIDRVHRIGSEVHESITIIDIVAGDTLEEAQLEALGAKQSRSDEITRD